MRYRTLAVFCLFGLLVQPVVYAQDFPNRATLEVNRLLLTAMVDKFAYAPGEPITAVFKVINRSATPIAIEASRTCPLIGRMELWCEKNQYYCIGWYDPVEFRCMEQVVFPHGETILSTKVFSAFQPGESLLIPDSGQILFFDPWGESPTYRIILEYDNSASVAVKATTWGIMKQLYRQ